MARREVGHGARRTVIGVRAGLIARNRRFDSTFCLKPHRECGWCADIAALEAGEAFAVTGQVVWLSVPHERRPSEYQDLMRDASVYRVLGANTIELVS